MIQLISITGTESTGKTELVRELAAHYQTMFVPDYSRLYIEKLSRDYNQNDVLEIANIIIEEESKMLQQANKIFFSDNCLVNIKIWLQYFGWEVPEWLSEEIFNRKGSLHLLCDIDLEWVADEQRKNPHDRNELFEQFKFELDSAGAGYKIISGKKNMRIENAVDAVDKFLSSLK